MRGTRLLFFPPVSKKLIAEHPPLKEKKNGIEILVGK